jgi:hypothetical protein
MEKEKQIGTIRYFLDFTVKNCLFALIFGLFSYILDLMVTYFYMVPLYSIFNYYIMHMTAKLYQDKNLSSR